MDSDEAIQIVVAERDRKVIPVRQTGNPADGVVTNAAQNDSSSRINDS